MKLSQPDVAEVPVVAIGIMILRINKPQPIQNFHPSFLYVYSQVHHDKNIANKLDEFLMPKFEAVKDLSKKD